MRVIAGTQKGRRLKAPIGNRIRPTSERVREALFSILGPDVSKFTVLDLCCGTGTIGLEALSRGATHVVFVDHDRDSLQFVRKNLEHFGSPSNAVVLHCDAWRVARQPQFLHYAPYDIIFVDPPYQHQELETLLYTLGKATILSQNGVMIVEHFWKTQLPQDVGCLKLVRQSRYGDTMLTFFQHSHTPHANWRLPRNV